MNDWYWTWTQILRWFIVIGVLICIFAWRPRAGTCRRLWLRFFLSMAVVWALLIPFRFFLELPQELQRAAMRGDDMADGVPGNAITLGFGWLVAAYYATPVLVISGVCRYVQTRRQKAQPITGANAG